MEELLKFIEEHKHENTDKILLSKSKWKNIDVDIAVNTISGYRKIKDKIPSWHACPGLIFPTSLCTEQCSSERTAAYKADIIGRISATYDKDTVTVADLTGGLGADSLAFSKICKVIHNEMNGELSMAVQHNFQILGASGIVFSKIEITPDTISDFLAETGADIVYADPGRRNGSGNKVFLPEDCSPDMICLKDHIFRHCNHILIKLSPMMDIDLAVKKFGNVKEVHVIGAKGECKEIVLLLEKNFKNQPHLFVSDENKSVCFKYAEEKSSMPVFFEKPDDVFGFEGKFLFEPCKALAKAGLFNTISMKENIFKAGKSSHVYFGYDCNLASFDMMMKIFKIDKVLPFCNKSISFLKKNLDGAEVSAKNITLSSDALRKKLNLTKGGMTHIFCVRIDAGNTSKNYLFLCSPF